MDENTQLAPGWTHCALPAQAQVPREGATVHGSAGLETPLSPEEEPGLSGKEAGHPKEEPGSSGKEAGQPQEPCVLDRDHPRPRGMKRRPLAADEDWSIRKDTSTAHAEHTGQTPDCRGRETSLLF